MKKITFLIFSFIFIFSQNSRALPLTPVVGGNGFSCVKTQLTVQCKGSFPGVPGVFSASGLHQINLVYETPSFPGNRYIFDSTTGCLMRIDFNGSGRSHYALVWNSAGIQKEFTLPHEQARAYQYCQGK